MAETSLEDLGIQNKVCGATDTNTSEDGQPTRDRQPAVCHMGICRVPKSVAGSGAFSFHQLLKNALTVCRVPEGVSMTARDVLTFKYLGSDYQH